MKGSAYILAIIIISLAPLANASTWERQQKLSYLALGATVWNFDNDDMSGGGFVQYRAASNLGGISPWVGVDICHEANSLVAVGLLMDIPLSNRFVLVPSFGAGYYTKEGNIELGCDFEFRSMLELSYCFISGQRLGLSIGHISNGGLGDFNPGIDMVGVVYSIPLGMAR